MIDTPQIVQTSEQSTAAIHLTVPRSEIQTVMGPAIGEVIAVLSAQQIAPQGSVFTSHFRRPTETFDFEVGVPVQQPVVPAGRVKPSVLPATRVARTVYHGPYEGLGAAWGELETWITANGHVSAENLWECYRIGPESGLEPHLWQTELNRPLIG